MASYSFTAPNMGGQGKSPRTGWHQASVGAGTHRPANKPQLVQDGPTSFTMTGPDFSDINALVAGVLDGDQTLVTNLIVYGSKASNRALATGRAARGKRR